MDDQSYNPNGSYNYRPKPSRPNFDGKKFMKIAIALVVVVVVAALALGSFYTIGEQGKRRGDDPGRPADHHNSRSPL